MIIGTVSRAGQTLLFKELKASMLVDKLTIDELCDIIAEQIRYERIDKDLNLKIAIIDTERKNIFHFSIDDIVVSLTLELDKE